MSIRTLRWISNNAKPYRLAVTSGKDQNSYNATKTPVSEMTKSISSTSKIPLNYDIVPLDSEGSIAGNTFLSRIGRHATRTQENLASKIRGSSGVVQRYQGAYRIFNPEALVYQCKYFKLNYYPPEHFLGLFRKTKPAVNVRESGEAHFNNNLQLEDSHRIIFRNTLSSLPKHYAVYRRFNRVFVKKHMLQQWCALNGDKAVEEMVDNKNSKTGAKYLDKLGRTKQGVAKDGFYVYMSLIFPDENNKKDLARHIKQSVTAVANLKWNQFLQSKKDNKRTWVENANSCLKPSTINRLLSQSEHSYTLSSFDEGPIIEE